MTLIDVAMSTYNGEKFLEEQLESILFQREVTCNLYVRDDGSTDQTKDILSRHSSEIAKLEFGDVNLGPKQSFFKILNDIEPGNYIAFADQDDIWLPDKLNAAVQLLEKYTGPAVYCSNVWISQKTSTSQVSTKLPAPGLPLNFFQNSAMGCTIVMNSQAHQVILGFEEQGIIMHDWGILLCIQSLGQVAFDPVPKMIYRIHPDQTIGLRRSSRLKKLFDLQQVEFCFLQFMSVKNFVSKLKINEAHQDAFDLVSSLISAKLSHRLIILFFGKNRFRSTFHAEIILRLKIFAYLTFKFSRD